MLSNTHFSMAVHLMCALAWNKGKLVGSQDLAFSVGTNPSFLRGLISDLREAGLVETRQGKGGGSTLARPAESITLQDVYRAMESKQLLKVHVPDCESTCVVARRMKDLLDDVNDKLENTLSAELKRTTVADLVAVYIA
jgi:Rrf2 family protein